MASLVHLGELVATGEPQAEVAWPGVDPALEPFHAALDGPGVARLAGQDRARGRRVVRLEEAVQPLLGRGRAGIEGQGDVRGTRDGVRGRGRPPAPPPGRGASARRRTPTLGPVGNHASNRAASRRAVGPLPPIQMGGPPGRCGLGSTVTFER